MGFYIAEIDKNKARKAKSEKLRGVHGVHLASASYRSDCLSKSPQAVVKVVSHLRSRSVVRSMNYISRNGDLYLETENGEWLRDTDQIKKRYDDWRTDFESSKPGSKRPPRHATHIILSAQCEKTAKNVQLIKSAVRQFLQENFGELGYEYVWTVHADTDYPHAHVIIKNYNRVLDKKIRLNKPELAAMRRGFAKQLSIRGIAQVATRRLDRPKTVEKVFAGIEKPKTDTSWYRATLAKIEKTHSTPGEHSERWLTRQMSRIDAMVAKQSNHSTMFRHERADLLARISDKRSDLMRLADVAPSKAAQLTLNRIGEELRALSKELAALSRKQPAEALFLQLAREERRGWDLEGVERERHEAYLQELRDRIGAQLEPERAQPSLKKSDQAQEELNDNPRRDQRSNAPFGIHVLKPKFERGNRRQFTQQAGVNFDQRDPFSPHRQPTAHHLRQVPSRDMAGASQRTAKGLLPTAAPIHRHRVGGVRRSSGRGGNAGAVNKQSWYYATLSKIEAKHSTLGLHEDKWLTRVMGKIDVLSKSVSHDLGTVNKVKELRRELLDLAQKRPTNKTRAQLKRIGENLNELGKELATYHKNDKEEKIKDYGYSARLQQRREKDRAASKWWDKQQVELLKAENVLKENIVDPVELKRELASLREYKANMKSSVIDRVIER